MRGGVGRDPPWPRGTRGVGRGGHKIPREPFVTPKSTGPVDLWELKSPCAGSLCPQGSLHPPAAGRVLPALGSVFFKFMLLWIFHIQGEI